MDDGRKYDLAELLELYRQAPNDLYRNHWGKLIKRISQETIEIRSLREELIAAIRRGDRRRVRYVQEELRIIDKNKTGGRETIKL